SIAAVCRHWVCDVDLYRPGDHGMHFRFRHARKSLSQSENEFASLDEEFGGPNKPVVPEQDSQRRRRRYIWFLLAGAALGMASIVLWPRVWFLAQSLPEQAASQISAGLAERSEELDALKKEISELRDWRQQISAKITALQSAHQEVQRSSAKVISWYS